MSACRGFPRARERPPLPALAAGPAPWADAARRGSRFAAAIGIQSAIGQYAHCQLWNPADRYVSVIVEQVILACLTATEVEVYIGDVAFTQLANVPRSLWGPKLRGVAELRGRDGTFIGDGPDRIADVTLHTEVPYPITDLGVMLVPGTGLHAVEITGNIQIMATFIYSEEPLAG